MIKTHFSLLRFLYLLFPLPPSHSSFSSSSSIAHYSHIFQGRGGEGVSSVRNLWREPQTVLLSHIWLPIISNYLLGKYQNPSFLSWILMKAVEASDYDPIFLLLLIWTSKPCRAFWKMRPQNASVLVLYHLLKRNLGFCCFSYSWLTASGLLKWNSYPTGGRVANLWPHAIISAHITYFQVRLSLSLPCTPSSRSPRIALIKSSLSLVKSHTTVANAPLCCP